jgi:hypothetical protein
MAAFDRRGQEQGGIKRFDPRILDRSVIAIPLLEDITEDENKAIMDSGIGANHPHFARHGNVDPASPLHADFTDMPNVPKGANAALIYRFGHDTHVAGIVAGAQVANRPKGQAQKMRVVTRSVKGYETGDSAMVETHEAQQRPTNAGMQVTINDRGNAELAITEGSTHREMSHVYGVSYFSSKGPPAIEE